jgi:hypothetical protein
VSPKGHNVSFMRRPATLPDWVLPSSPGLNRPLIPAVERVARPVRACAEMLAQSIDHEAFETLYAPTRQGLGFTLVPADRGPRSAWALVAEWLVAFSAGAISAQGGFHEAHAWFWRGHPHAALLMPPEYNVPLPDQTTSAEVRALLPYLLDSMSASTRRDVLSARSTADQRANRKESGVYYTPGDVAHLMVSRALAATGRTYDLWLDPAHGSGVFLRAVLSACHNDAGIRNHLYGVDLDPMAAETTAFVLTSEDLHLRPFDSAGELKHEGEGPWQRWHTFRRNLATGDALLIDTRHIHDSPPFDVISIESSAPPLGLREPWQLERAFPEVAGRGFDRVVANPPYGSLQPNLSTFYIPHLHPVTGAATSADISPLFVEIAASVLTESGAFAIVTPLSEITSTRSPFPELRRHLVAQPGAVEFVAFDRVPDALFGDDVKTRNAIIYLDKAAEPGVHVSPLYRWTSKTRATALNEAPIVEVSGIPGTPTIIPKIGRDWERELYQACLRHTSRVDSWVTRRSARTLDQIQRPAEQLYSDVIALAPTAYNFLGVTRDPYRAVTDGHDSQNALSILHFKSEAHASSAYAALCSRVAFWAWHVTGDGFHVSALLTRLSPVPDENSDTFAALANLGDQLWKEAIQRPTVSSNRGRTTVTYPTSGYGALLNAIDAQLGCVLGTSATLSLADWHEALIVVDADSKRRNISRRSTT